MVQNVRMNGTQNSDAEHQDQSERKYHQGK